MAFEPIGRGICPTSGLPLVFVCADPDCRQRAFACRADDGCSERHTHNRRGIVLCNWPLYAVPLRRMLLVLGIYAELQEQLRREWAAAFVRNRILEESCEFMLRQLRVKLDGLWSWDIFELLRNSDLLNITGREMSKVIRILDAERDRGIESDIRRSIGHIRQKLYRLQRKIASEAREVVQPDRCTFRKTSFALLLLAAIVTLVYYHPGLIPSVSWLKNCPIREMHENKTTFLEIPIRTKCPTCATCPPPPQAPRFSSTFINVETGNKQTHQNLTMYCYSQKHPAADLDVCSQNKTALYTFKAFQLYRADKEQEAIKWINKAIALNGGSRDLHYLKSLGAFHIGKYKLALKQIKIAIKLSDKFDPQLYLHRAKVYIILDKLDKALQDLQFVADSGLEDATVSLYRCFAYYSLDMEKQAIEYCLDSLSRTDDYKTNVLNILWKSYLTIGDFLNGFKYLNEMYTHDPTAFEQKRKQIIQAISDIASKMQSPEDFIKALEELANDIKLRS